MNRYAIRLAALTSLLASGQGRADVIYSGLQNITIPTTYNGVYIDVDGIGGWDLNPFMGGVYLYNSSSFQLARSGIGSLDTALNLTPGSTIGSGLNFATGSGGSLDHLGTQFTASQEGYLGFRLNSAHYGSMRVVFTNNDVNAVIKDWAYDTSGASVQVGAIKQVGQDDILSSGFTLAASSALIDSGGATNLVKNGSGTNILKSNSTYTGTTSVNAGTLEIATGGSTHASSAVTISNSGSALVVNGTVNGTLLANTSTTLSGSGTVNGAATVNGNLNAGNGGAGLLTFGSSLAMANTTASTMEINGITVGINYDAIDAAGGLTYDGALTLAIGATFGNGTYTFDLFDFGSQTGSFDTLALSGTYGNVALTNNLGVWSTTTNSGNETWTFTQSTGNLSLVVIPEPNVAALLGGLGALMLLRRRR
jgi:autotransporter-associated beta strand protein